MAPLPVIAPLLLAWYDQARRHLPWRYAPGEQADSYRVWLSEIMLQQTTVRAVIPYFEAFTERWPTVEALAAAPLDEVLTAWAGLGYYSRARNLHACANVIAAKLGGQFPKSVVELRALPGIGPYTAGAIAAIAYGVPATVVDGNVERVVARVFAEHAPLPGAKARLHELASLLTPQVRPGDYAQSMMDLGATVCTPRRPQCGECPIAARCRGYALGVAAALPKRAAKAVRPVKFGVAYVVVREDGRVLLRRRPETGLLAGLYEVPTTEWLDAPPNASDVRRAEPVRGRWQELSGGVTHIFTHLKLELAIRTVNVGRKVALSASCQPALCQWVHPDDFGSVAIPSLMTKVLQRGLAAARV